MPVQPMKSIAPVFVAEFDNHLSVPQIMVAGLSTTAVLFLLGATGIMSFFGLMNLVKCWFRAMPVCHDAGRLARQYRFGGQSGASILLLGIGKMALGLAFGSSFMRILGVFLIGILGALLLFSGVEFAMASRDMGSKEESFVMLVCAAVSLTGSSAVLGFGSGILLFLLLKLRDCERGRWFGRGRVEKESDHLMA